MAGTLKKASKTQVIIDVVDGEMVNYDVDITPEMLNFKGVVIPSTTDGISFRFDKRYVASKLKHDVFDKLGIDRHGATLLVMEAYKRA